MFLYLYLFSLLSWTVGSKLPIFKEIQPNLLHIQNSPAFPDNLTFKEHKCPPSSSNLMQTGYLVSVSIPLMLMFVRRGRLIMRKTLPLLGEKKDFCPKTVPFYSLYTTVLVLDVKLASWDRDRARKKRKKKTPETNRCESANHDRDRSVRVLMALPIATRLRRGWWCLAFPAESTCRVRTKQAPIWANTAASRRAPVASACPSCFAATATFLL